MGVTTSGENIFAYGYSNRQTAGDVVIKSDGWAVKFSHVGKPLSNTIYAEENAIIEFTAATGGYDQNSWTDEGNVAIGGSKKTAMGYKAFATQFYHTYDKDY